MRQDLRAEVRLTTKKNAIYDRAKPHSIAVGVCAFIYPVQHHDTTVSCMSYASTSVVERYDPATGIFETANTIYYPDE